MIKFPKRSTQQLLYTAALGVSAAAVFPEYRTQIALGTMPVLGLLYTRWRILHQRWKRRGAPRRRREDFS